MRPDEAIGLLASEAVIPKKIEPNLRRLVNDVSSKTPFREAVRDTLMARSAADPTLPRMRGMWTRCLLVASYEPEYKAHDDAAAYAPKLRGFTPLVALQIDVNVFGTTERFSLGLSEDELASMINRLRLAQKQLEVVLAGAKAKPIG